MAQTIGHLRCKNMRPNRIILIRHGKSEGNADKSLLETIPDYALNLTQEGIEQARQAGQEIKKIIGQETLQVYVSPYYRTRQTYRHIQESIQENVVKAFEDPRIREQDWGHLRNPDLNEEIIHERNGFSTFYYRIPDGESGADVYDRVSIFLETLHRDFQKSDYAENVLIVTHGMTLRLFLMRWFHWSVEEFELLRNPLNCQIVIMQKDSNDRYNLIGELVRRK
jgi:broad specificity phosphatase PhoE